MNEWLACDEPHTYQIKVDGELDESWMDWFDGFGLHRENNFTMITGVVPDQVALRYILNQLWDFNLVLVSIVRLE